MEHLHSIFDISFWKKYLGSHWFGGSMALLGLAVVLSKLKSGVHTVYRHFLRPVRDLQERYGNGWVVISDASDPVGAAYAKILGKRFNLLLLQKEGQNIDPEIAERVRKAGNHIETVMVEYQDVHGSDTFNRIRGFFGDKQVGIVVINNLNHMRKDDKEGKGVEDTVTRFQEAVMFPLLLQRCLIPNMLRREKKSAVITLSHLSIDPSSHSKILEISVKAFITAFSRSLAAEYKGKIDALSLEVGSVTGADSFGAWFQVPPNVAVKAQLAHIGYEKSGSGHWKHELEKRLSKYS